MNKLKKITAVFMAVLMLIVGVSCGDSGKDYIYNNKTEDYIFKHTDFVIDKNLYTYWIARYKAVLKYTYSDFEDTEKFWSQDFGNGSACDVITAYADETVKNYLVSVYLFSKYGLPMTESRVNSIDSQLAEIVNDGYDGDVSKLNEQAYQYGINYNMLRQIYIAEAKTEIVREYLMLSVLRSKLTDELRDSYLYDNYARTEHIFIATNYAYNIDEDGNYIYDENGKYTSALTDEQKAEKQGIVDEIDSLGLNAENFDEYRKKYNEDRSLDVYENGYFVSLKTDLNKQYITAALSMEVGEVKKIETDIGVYYILKKPMIAKAFNDKKNADFFSSYDQVVLDYLYWEEMKSHYKNITVNEELKKSISIKDVKPCFDF